MRRLRLLFFTVGIFFSLSSFSQSVTPSVLNATGGTSFFTFYRYEWSFGEMLAIETMPSPNLIVTNGVLQPGTHNPATIDNTGDWGADEIKILPNPTKNLLEIDFFSKQKGKVSIRLYDAMGRFMAERQFDYYGVGYIDRWNFSPFASGTYFFHIRLAPTGSSVAKKGSYRVVKLK